MGENQLKKDNKVLPDLSADELSLYEEKIDALLLEMEASGIKKDKEEQKEKKTPTVSKEEIYQDIRKKIQSKYNFYYKEHHLIKNKSQIESCFENIESELNKISSFKSQDINIQLKLSKEDDSRLNDLFILLETEVKDSRKKLNLSGIKISHTMSLDREALKKEFDKYEPDVISQSEELNEISSNLDIPYPSKKRIFAAFFIDLLVSLIPTAYCFHYLNIDKIEILSMFFLSTWFIFQILFTILLNGSIGQKSLSLSFFSVDKSDLNNTKKAPKSALLLRSVSQLFPPYTFLKVIGLLNKFAKQQKCIYCPLSNTNMTFTVFINET